MWRLRFAFAAVVVAAPTALLAQDIPGPANDLSDQVEQANAATEAAHKSRDLIIVPIPHSSPALGSGLTLVAGLFYNPNKSPEPWITGAGAMYTSNKSKALGIAHKMSLANDGFRLIGFAGYADVNMRFYGIGPDAGERGLSIKLNEKGFAGVLQGQARIFDHLYLGPRVQFLKLESSVLREKPLFPDDEIPRAEFDSQLLGFGLVASFDRRDSSLNPHNGELVQGSAIMSRKSLGSDFDYEKYTFNANIYRPVTKSTTIAGRAALCRVTDGAPFYDLCMYGMNNDLRGYEVGRFRDGAYWAAQMEVRQHLFGRFGAVVFGGIGESATSVSNFGDGKWLPAWGLGLRYQPTRTTPINLRVDYAWGKDSHALNISVGEAF